jgi:signal transduction histidine kinase
VALQQSPDGQGHREAIGSMLEETERLTRLVDNLLTLARGDSGPIDRDIHPIDISQLVHDVVGELRILAEERSQVLSEQLQSDLEVPAEAQDIRGAVVNVLHNAIRYGQESGRIEIRTARAETGDAVIDIIDDGQGIPESERSRVFERFYRIQTPRTGGGAGLGLSIAQQAVEANGGSISFIDSAAGGTHCRIILPAAGPQGAP